MISVLGDILDDYPYIKQLADSGKYYHGSLLLPQSLRDLYNEFNRNQDLVKEAVGFLDAVCLISLDLYNNHDTIVSGIKSIICSNRVVTDLNSVINLNVMDDYMFQTEQDVMTTIDNNPIITSIYIYLLVKQTTVGVS